MRPDLRQIRFFIALAEELHFNRAAERLNVTQPALSRTLKELEAGIGVPLLQRTTRSVELTEAGSVFLAECRLALGHLERAVSLARRTAEGLSGELRIAYMDFAINGRLPELLRAFRSRHPGIRVELSFMPTTAQQAALLEHRIDLGFMIGLLDNGRFEHYAFEQQPYVALLPATHPLLDAPSTSLDALAREPFILGSGENWTAYRNRLFAICHRHGFYPDIVQEASSSEGIFGLVAGGIGVTVYAGCARNVLRRGVVVRALDDVHEHIPVCACWDAGGVSPSLQRFVQFMKSVWGG
ncbi:LysR family transcriptional regulator [Plasticicumulans acidivorans]|uniref:LysR family transcriptional regulator n=1 Tax=Plasticicumulans acidivorans TaxID=886464 RepID=A0A317MW09_9GAMM|nr:LysR substrate-binding domain-containing protein [Plasticicumulans acidivorans]PWV62263.1 LysR family transcriptional regulator [Plasticicumulans acidivorans]